MFVAFVWAGVHVVCGLLDKYLCPKLDSRGASQSKRAHWLVGMRKVFESLLCHVLCRPLRSASGRMCWSARPAAWWTTCPIPRWAPRCNHCICCLVGLLCQL